MPRGQRTHIEIMTQEIIHADKITQAFLQAVQTKNEPEAMRILSSNPPRTLIVDFRTMEDGESFLQMAIKWGLNKLVDIFTDDSGYTKKIMVARNSDDGDSVLHTLARYTTVETLAAFHHREPVLFINRLNTDGETPLSLALQREQPIRDRLVTLFLQMGANPAHVKQPKNKRLLNQYCKTLEGLKFLWDIKEGTHYEHEITAFCLPRALAFGFKSNDYRLIQSFLNSPEASMQDLKSALRIARRKQFSNNKQALGYILNELARLGITDQYSELISLLKLMAERAPLSGEPPFMSIQGITPPPPEQAAVLAPMPAVVIPLPNQVLQQPIAPPLFFIPSMEISAIEARIQVCVDDCVRAFYYAKELYEGMKNFDIQVAEILGEIDNIRSTKIAFPEHAQGFDELLSTRQQALIHAQAQRATNIALHEAACTLVISYKQEIQILNALLIPVSPTENPPTTSTLRFSQPTAVEPPAVEPPAVEPPAKRPRYEGSRSNSHA